MKRAVAVIIILLIACGAPEPPPKPPGTPKKPYILPPPSDEAERSNLVNIAYGATVISRTGEVLLESSAIAATDGDPVSAWINPPKDFPLSLVVELGAPARIDRVGVRQPAKAAFVAKEIVFETSMDGRTFKPLARFPGKGSDVDAQWLDVKPVDAAFLRVTATAPSQADGNVAINSILAHGRELAPAQPGSIDGTWILNCWPTEFRTHGAHTSGLMYAKSSQIFFEGGSNGRLHRFEWIRGPEFGYTVIAVAPDGLYLNGWQWHEEAVPLFFGDAWFGGNMGQPATTEIKVDVGREFLKRTGRHSLYALRFAPDGTLDVAASEDALRWLVGALREHPHARLVAHEFREKTAVANRARAQRTLDSLAKALQNAGVEPSGVTFVAAGSDNARQIPGSEAARELYSTVDLEVGR